MCTVIDFCLRNSRSLMLRPRSSGPLDASCIVSVFGAQCDVDPTLIRHWSPDVGSTKCDVGPEEAGADPALAKAHL